MKARLLIVVCLSLATWASATTRITMIRNEKVVAYEELVHQAENESGSEGMKAGHPNLTVFLSGGLMSIIPETGNPVTKTVKRGDAIFREVKEGKIRSIAADEIHFMRIELTGKGSTETWGTTGLPAGSNLLIENRHARVYEVRIPAGGSAPLQTRNDAALVVLAGAQLHRVLPDGRQENINLRANKCVWRLGGNQVVTNVGMTDLWIIAVEPK